jgi:hypothetical protein
MNRPTMIGRLVRGAFFGALAVTTLAAVGSGCLDRPVAPATPLVSARVVTLAKQNKVNKIDLLFMIDNSSSMADKQNIMADAVPELVNRLIEPKCVDPITLRTVGNAVNGVCTMGGELDFEPIKDIHIGIVTSSLGNHGANGVCEDAIDASLNRADPHNNDQGHLISRASSGMVPTYLNKGFLYYNPSVSGGLANAQQVAVPFTEMVRGVGQHGCGYEASLEAVYRFLVDPDPYDTVRIDLSGGGFGQAALNGTDKVLLAQRKDFLRPDSLVSIMIMTDENDCSVIDGSQGFYALLPPVAGTGRSVLKPGTSKCKDNPNDPCCFNCGVVNQPNGCAPAASDPACQAGELPVNDDQPNLRCYEQKRRYGADFLYPVQRYIDGFSKAKVPNRKGEMVDNPLFSDLTCATPGMGCTAERDKSLVFVAGIVGVPWQDIALDDKDLTKGYKTAKQLEEDNVWANIIGDPSNPGGPVPPGDIHMVESIKPRNTLPGPGSGPNADIKNGHEWDPSKDTTQPNADLQYACIFDLVPSKMCMDQADCDCFGTPDALAAIANPLCQNAQGTYTKEQLRAKAYPGTRILQVLRGIESSQAIVASICPANVRDMSKDDYGYSPAIRALVGRLRNALRGRCLPRTLEVVTKPGPTQGNVPCIVVEAFKAGKCECDKEPGRVTAAPEIVTPEMAEKDSNGVAKNNCFCEIKQLQGNGQTECKTNLNPMATAGDGWCYVDPQQGSNGEFDMNQCPIVRACPATDKRLIKFINTNSEPRTGATAYIMCQEQSFPTNGGQGMDNMQKCP